MRFCIALLAFSFTACQTFRDATNNRVPWSDQKDPSHVEGVGVTAKPAKSPADIAADNIKAWCATNRSALNQPCELLAAQHCKNIGANAIACANQFANTEAWPTWIFCKSTNRKHKTEEKCLWEFEHPVEAKCEQDAGGKGRAGYWECMRYHEEKAWHDEQSERQEAIANEQRRRDEERLQDERNERAEAKQQHDNEVIADGIRKMGEAFQKASGPPKTTICTTTPTYGGGATTECH